jgi:integrase
MTGHAPSRETMTWLSRIDGKLRSRLAAVELAEQRTSKTLADFIDDYIASRTDVKPSTRIMWNRNRAYLVEYFGAEKPVRAISQGDADLWRLHLLGKGLADNTVRRSCGLAKQLFSTAVRRRLIDTNPFTDLPASVRRNADRFYFVSREEATKVLTACPDAEWRLLFALARFGGLRVPSEVLLLRWSDIDWAGNRFTVTSPKTEHHEGGGSRIVPIFPELLPYLIEAFGQAAEGAEFCITRYRRATVNLRTHLQRIIKRAGLKSWPKLWQNLRSTRETELADHFPAHVAAAWIGNSVAVATKHYLQVTDDHFGKAVAENSALQNALQQAHADKRTEAHEEPVEEAEPANITPEQRDALVCASQGSESVGDKGLEPSTSRV